MSTPPNNDRIRAISLFSGLGGLDIGLHNAGVETLVCVEKNETAARTLRINSERHDATTPLDHITIPERYPWAVINEDIRSVTATDILETAGVDSAAIDLVVGGPPCQTFSRSNEGNRVGTDTERGKLYQEYARILHEIQPTAFLFENVRGLESSNDGRDLQQIRSRLEGDTYTTDYRVLNAADYGVPQTRKRLFIIGIKDDHEPAFPDPTHSETGENGTKEWVSAGGALRAFTIDEPIEERGGYRNAIGSKYGPLLRDIPEGANYQHFSERRYDPEDEEYVERADSELDEKHFDWRSRHWNYLLKTDRQRPCWTLQAAPGSTVGPFHWRSRNLSLYEQMKLMDLPLDYYIAGPPGAIQTQIGNAVPPTLVEAVVQQLLTTLGLYSDAVERNTPRSHPTATSQPIGEPTFTVEVTSERSPWTHADRILNAILAEEAVVVRAEGRAIPHALDALEIARRQAGEEIEVEIDETMRKGDGLKGGCTSVLEVTATTQTASAKPRSPMAT